MLLALLSRKAFAGRWGGVQAAAVIQSRYARVSAKGCERRVCLVENEDISCNRGFEGRNAKSEDGDAKVGVNVGKGGHGRQSENELGNEMDGNEVGGGLTWKWEVGWGPYGQWIVSRGNAGEAGEWVMEMIRDKWMRRARLKHTNKGL